MKSLRLQRVRNRCQPSLPRLIPSPSDATNAYLKATVQANLLLQVGWACHETAAGCWEAAMVQRMAAMLVP